MDFNQLTEQFLANPGWLSILFIWGIFWKGWALWKASQKKHLVWFLLFLVINTLGILEIAYIFYLNRWDLDKGKLLAFFERKFKKK